MFVRLLAVSAVLMSLSACAVISSGEDSNLERYTLTGDVPARIFTLEIPVVKVKLTPILASGGVVIETGEVTMRPARNHRYSFDLDRELSLLVMNEYEKKGIPKELQTEIYVSKFQGTYDGFAEVEIYVKVKTARNRILYEKELSSHTPLRKDGYAALVEELKKQYLALVDDFSDNLLL